MLWGGFHAHGGFVEAVHVALHLIQKTLLLTFRDAAETHSVTGHANGQAFFEAAVLAAVAVHAHYQAVLVLHAHLVVDVLLNAAAEKALAAFTCMDTIVEP